MELNKEFIEKNQLSEVQVTAINSETESHEAKLKQSWDGVANENAEKIIDGAALKVETLTGIKRENGQKIADYLSSTSEIYFAGQKADFEKKQTELEEKIKNSKGDDLLRNEYDDLKGKFDLLQQKEAQFKDWEENDYKGKLELSQKELDLLILDISFTNVKPNFPETVNKFEAEAKWNDFKTKTLNENTIEIDKNKKSIAINKENKHKIIDLSKLVDEDKDISSLMQGRKVTGLGGNTKTDINIENIPFKVPEKATPEERQKAIKDYLQGELKLSITNNEYSKKYTEYNKIIMEKNP